MTRQPQTGLFFAVVWEFRVSPRRRRAFEKVYGPEGDWARLFRTAKGYVRTELLRDRNMPGRYLTIDYWQSGQALAVFKKRNHAAYTELDEKCAALTEAETLVGEFNT
jgi:heme-degrading monooxygenase HmoA